jgi:ComF family protein
MYEHLTLGLVRTLVAFKNALLPHRCLACKSFIAPPPYEGTHRNSATLSASARSDASAAEGSGRLRTCFDAAMVACLCPVCRGEYQPPASPICTVCGRMFTGREGPDHLCGDCIETPKHYHKARAAAISTPALMKVIHQFKYNRKLQPAKALSAVLLSAFCEYWPERDIQTLMPVPLHMERMRQRGFNQAYLLIRDWRRLAEKFGLEPGNMTLDKYTLIRKHRTRPQTGLGKTRRHRNVRNAFAVRAPENIRQKNVLLLDDVYTTGATVNECARVLRQNGAARVDVLTLVHAM